MTPLHKKIALGIMLIIIVICYCFDAAITDTVSESLITFFSIVFGFYITSIAILYSASFASRLYESLDETGTKREIHNLKNYVLNSGYWSLFSICLIIVFTVFASKEEDDKLFFTTKLVCMFEVNLIITSIIFGIAAVNVFFMILFLKTMIEGMVEEARNRVKSKK